MCNRSMKTDQLPLTVLSSQQDDNSSLYISELKYFPLSGDMEVRNTQETPETCSTHMSPPKLTQAVNNCS